MWHYNIQGSSWMVFKYYSNFGTRQWKTFELIPSIMDAYLCSFLLRAGWNILIISFCSKWSVYKSYVDKWHRCLIWKLWPGGNPPTCGHCLCRVASLLKGLTNGVFSCSSFLLLVISHCSKALNNTRIERRKKALQWPHTSSRLYLSSQVLPLLLTPATSSLSSLFPERRTV